MLGAMVFSVIFAVAPEDTWEANNPGWRVAGVSRTWLPYSGREVSFLAGAGSFPDFGIVRGVGVYYSDDKKTGVGGVSASAAISVARGLAGRVFYGQLVPAAPYGSISKTYLFPVCRQRMRFVLSWSASYSCNFCSMDADDVEGDPANRVALLNANMYLFDGTAMLGASRSVHNNYEIIDVPSPPAQFTRLEIRGASTSRRPEWFGLAMYCYDVDGQGIPASD
ncbi:MAG: hypothetical protein AMXMBFR34_24160 [Myxococcaceae bacterium]